MSVHFVGRTHRTSRKSGKNASAAKRVRVASAAALSKIVEPLEKRVLLTSTSVVDHSAGFADSSDLQLNGNTPAHVSGTKLVITDGHNNEANSAFTTLQEGIDTFDTTFEYDYGTTAPAADGFVFVVQGNNPGAVQGGGGNLAYGGMANSIGIKFDLYDGAPANSLANPKPTNQDSYTATGLYIDGAAAGTDDPRIGADKATVATPAPAGTSVDLANNSDGTPTGIQFHTNATDKYMVHIVYAGGSTITETVTDETNGKSVNVNYDLGLNADNTPRTLQQIISGDPTAPTDFGYVGFTGATGGANATQEIQTWKYSGTEPTASAATPVTGLTAAFDPTQSGDVLNWTDGAVGGGQVNIIQRSTNGTAGPFTTIGRVPGDATTFVDTQQTGLQMGGNYTYQVVAANNIGTAAPSNPAGPVAVPGPASNIGVEAHVYNTQFWQGPAISPTDRFLNINIDYGNGTPDPAVKDHNTFSVIYTGKITTGPTAGQSTFISNSDDDGYLYVNGQLVSSDPGPHGQREATDAVNNTQGQVIPITLSPNTSYDFVFYLNQRGGGAGAHMEWITPDFTTEAPVQASNLTPTSDVPGAPTGLAQDVANTGPNIVALTWTDNSDKSSMYYEVDRAPASGGAASGPFAEVGRAFGALNGSLTLGATSFQDTGITPGGQYAYQVRAVGADGNSSFSNIVVVNVPSSGKNPGLVEEHLFNTSMFAEMPQINELAKGVDVNAGNGTFDPSIRGSQNSSAWTGKIHIDTTGTYTFISNTDDEGWLYVNGILVSEDLGGHGQQDAKNFTPLQLTGGQDYDFLLLQNNQGGGSGAHLEWVTPAMQAAGKPPALIPLNHLSDLSDKPAAPTSLMLDPDTSITNNTANQVQFLFTADNNAVFRYLLQRSSDSGATWLTVGQADPGSNDLSADNVTYVPGGHIIDDAQPIAGGTFQYRVVSMNFDKTSDPSNVVTVTVPAQLNSKDLSGATGGNPAGYEFHYYNGEIFRGGEQFDTRLISDVPVEAGINNASIDNNVGGTPASPDNAVRSKTDPNLSDIYRVHPQSYSVVFTGKIVTDAAGVYTLVTNTDDDGFLYINDQLVSADPGGHGQQNADPTRAGDTLVPVTLAANTAYNYAFFMTNVGGGSGYHLLWVEPGAAAGAAPTLIPAYSPGTSPTGGLAAVEDTPTGPVDAASNPNGSAAANIHLIKTSSEIEVVWDDVSTSELGFEVQRSSDGGKTFQTLAYTGIDEHQYIDKGAQSGSFQYRVRGWNYDGIGPFSAIASTSTTTSPQAIDHSGGFTSGTDLQLNGTATLTGTGGSPANALQLVQFDKANTQTGTAIEQTLQGVATFDTTFTFEFNPNNAGADPLGSALTFLLEQAHTSGQNGSGGPYAVGVNGASLGYVGIDHSVDIKFRLGGGRTATGVYTGGTTNDTNPQPINPNVVVNSGVAIDMTKMTNPDGTVTPTGLNFHTNPNDQYMVHLVYDGKILTETFTDVTKSITVSQQYKVDVVGAIGDTSAFVGFTGTHGGGGGEQDVLNWKYSGTDTVTGGNNSDTITGTSGNDAITISKDTDGTDIDWTLNGGPVNKVAITDPNGLTINGNGGTDTITFDNTNGNPLPNLLNLNQTGAGSKFVVSGLQAIGAGQKVEIANSTVQVNYSGNSPLSLIQGYLKGGQITSSAVAANPKLAIADIDSALGGLTGQPANTVLLQPALKGDTNLDHKVDFSDLVNLARNYGKTGQDWLHGDFDYNGKVDFSDLVALARNYGQTQAAVTPANANLTAMAIQAGSALVEAQKKKAPAARKH